MNTIFMNSKTSNPHRLLLILSDKINLKRKDKYVALSNLSIYYTWKNVKKLKVYKNNKFKISAPKWNDKFELLGGPYPLSDTQDYFENITKKHETVTDNRPIKIYANKIETRLTFNICRVLFRTFDI